MHPEIEKLIDFAISDGQVTEKERNVIFKKASELGVDQDEVEMVLEGRLHQIQASSSKPTKEKVGKIKTCPACGSTVPPFVDNCKDCGNIFRNDSLNELTTSVKGSEYKANEISNTIIPINKEAIVEYITFSIGNVKNKGLSLEQRWAWHAKMDEAFLKAESIFSKNEYEIFQQKYSSIIRNAASKLNEDTPKTQQQIEEDKRSDIFGYAMALIILYFMISLIARLFGAHIWPF